jgi:hypothetical protein
METKSYPDKKKMCHRTGFEKSCRDLLDSGACQGRWVEVIGRNPQTDAAVHAWGCVDDQVHLLQLAVESRLIGIQAAVESRGNETIKMLGESILRQDHQHREAIGLAGVESRLAPPAPQKLIAVEPN